MQPIGYDKKKASQILELYDVDVLIASTSVNVFYTTGLPTLHVANNPILWVLKKPFPYIALVRRDGELSLFYWMVFASLSNFSWVEDATGIVSPQQAMRGVSDKLQEWEIADGKTIGLETRMPRYQSEYLRAKFLGAKFIDADEAFLRMRLTKSPEEIKRIRKSTEIAEHAILTMFENVHENITDIELLQIARRAIVNDGAEGWDHLTIGIGSADPEAPGIGTPMKKGELSRFDIGAVWKGYVSDVSREIVLGTIPDGAEEVMDRMLKVQDFCVDHIQPGVAPKEVHETGMKFHKTLKKLIKPYITCHSIGLECEEAHMFSRMHSMDIPFEKNMVVDIEVWQDFKDYGLIGIEDCYQVTSSGCKRISTLDREIFVK